MRMLKAYASRALNQLPPAPDFTPDSAPDSAPDFTPDSTPDFRRGLVGRGLVSARRQRWWTKGGSKRYINDERSLAGAIRYVVNQDRKHGSRRPSP